MAPAFGAPERAQSAFASSRFDAFTFSSAFSDSLNDGSREAFALLVAGLPLSGEEVAYGTADLAFDIAEAMLLLLDIDLDLASTGDLIFSSSRQS